MRKHLKMKRNDLMIDKMSLSRGGQLIVATHSPILMAYPQADILRFDGPGGVERVDYRDTEHYRITREFLSAPERMLSVLLVPEEEET